MITNTILGEFLTVSIVPYTPKLYSNKVSTLREGLRDADRPKLTPEWLLCVCIYIYIYVCVCVYIYISDNKNSNSNNHYITQLYSREYIWSKVSEVRYNKEEIVWTGYTVYYPVWHLETCYYWASVSLFRLRMFASTLGDS